MPRRIRPHARASSRLALSLADWSLTGGYASTQSGITGTLAVPSISFQKTIKSHRLSSSPFRKETSRRQS
ncbi:hypothetical protein [Candidatus Borrarchaeum sp.]|uniref:hypothetical protein n=1 Tax=Candidatus Borrarchaeum sp. TaxID=2846742 RepID=UPI00257A8098|nr:hypothetical protein [Candidatus Borrarchaeum sp.]